MKSRFEYRKELIEAAASAAVRLLDSDRTGVRWPFNATLNLLERAWLDGHKVGSGENPKPEELR
jgi:hypothetical protein